MKSALGARWPLAMYTSPPEVDGDGDVDHGGIHPEYQRRIYLLVNPPSVYPPGCHHHHVG